MEASTRYCAYLAVTPAEYKGIARPQELKPSVFSYRSKDKYLKLFPFKRLLSTSVSSPGQENLPMLPSISRLGGFSHCIPPTSSGLIY